MDAVVVVAGFAGLAAADELRKAGRSFVVLEARRRVGGRVLNRSIGGGEVVEIGGQWVGPTQDRVLALIDELGLETFKTYVDGQNVYYRQANPGPLQRQTYTGTRLRSAAVRPLGAANGCAWPQRTASAGSGGGR